MKKIEHGFSNESRNSVNRNKVKSTAKQSARPAGWCVVQTFLDFRTRQKIEGTVENNNERCAIESLRFWDGAEEDSSPGGW